MATDYVPLSTYLTPELKTALEARVKADKTTVRKVVEAALASYLASTDTSPPVKRIGGMAPADAVEHCMLMIAWLQANEALVVRGRDGHVVHLDHIHTSDEPRPVVDVWVAVGRAAR